MQAVKDTVLGNSDAATEKTREAEEQVRGAVATAGKHGKHAKDAASKTADKVQDSATKIAEEAQHAWNAQHGESAWQKVGHTIIF